MKTAKRTVTVLAIAAVVCAGAYYLFCQNSNAVTSQTVATNVVDRMQNSAQAAKANVVNAALDATGIKARLQDVLEANSSAIAQSTGISQATVDAAIANMDIESWKVASLPSTASTEATYAVTYQGADTTVTTYSDPSYVTVSALGQAVTLNVPADAQSSLAYLPYVS